MTDWWLGFLIGAWLTWTIIGCVYVYRETKAAMESSTHD